MIFNAIRKQNMTQNTRITQEMKDEPVDND
jgi:hypothetical protein